MGAVKNAMIRAADGNSWDASYGGVTDQIGDILTAKPKASKPRPKLYQMPRAYLDIIERIEDADGEITPEIAADLDALDATLEGKTDSILSLVANAEAEAAYFEAEARAFAPELERIAARKRVATNLAERLKGYLKTTMIALGRDRVEATRFKVRIQKNSRPSFKWTGEPDEIPEALRTVTIDLDDRETLAAYRAGTLDEPKVAIKHGSHLRVR